MPVKEDISAYRKGFLKEKKYSLESQTYLKKRVFDTYHNLLVHRGLEGFSKGKKNLDLGSADLSFVKVCKENGVESSGLDISDNINFETDSFPIDSETIDIVTATSVIEHLYSPSNFMNEIWRVLKPGAAVILVCPNWRYSYKNYFNDPTHVHPYTEISLSRVLKNFNFENEYIVPWLVKKPAWMWDMPKAFFIARWMIPFRGDASRYIPSFLKGSSGSVLAMAIKPHIKKK